MNIMGRGGKILLFILPAEAAAQRLQSGFPAFAALPESFRRGGRTGHFFFRLA